MRKARLRIRSVRFKNGGASLHVIQGGRAREADYLRHCLQEGVRDTLDIAGDNLAGYCLVAWDVDGTTHSCWLNAEDVRFVNYASLPGFVSEVLRARKD